MSATDAAVKAVMETLVQHQSDGLISSRDQWVGCICGERLPCCIEDGYADEDEEHRARAAHVAVAAADAAVDADRASIQAETLRAAAKAIRARVAAGNADIGPNGRVLERRAIANMLNVKAWDVLGNRASER